MRHRIVQYELWKSESEESYALLYFPDVCDRHVRPTDQRVVWSVAADSFEAAIQAQYDHLGWGQYPSPPVPWAYPPAKRTHLACYDYGQGGVWALIDAESGEQVAEKYPELQVVEERPDWLSLAEQWRLADSMHFDVHEEPSGWLADLVASRA